ncbi:AAA family ATPase [Halobacillus rhizosphaerae]|uniref:AAA family ATPase n=1 Tax=Halobacillus rhizosphaerae TaxID=3064889 RepID=UPI00398AAEFA
MSKKIFLEKLTLIGFRKNYDVKFKEGLNFISGPMATGKSSIAEMINYVFGSEDHKSYIEIRKSCKDVELDFFIGDSKFKLVRPLFDFTRPVKLYKWDKNKLKYEDDFELLEIDTPSNENSLSAFLLREMGLPNIKVANQSFSFRDILKYSYVKQSDIDSENMLMEESWGSSLKRKPTFEIIFNIYNELLGELKQELKEKKELINNLQKKKEGVYEFLKDIDILEEKDYLVEKNNIKTQLEEKKDKLQAIKSEGKFEDELTMNLEKEIGKYKELIEIKEGEILEKNKYMEKLMLLRNQYSSEIQKIEFILEGAVVLNKYDFEVCPSCLNELEHNNGCNLCGSKLEDLSEEEIKVFKSELRRLKKKLKKIGEQIEYNEILLNDYEVEKRSYNKQLLFLQREIDHLRNNYISPYIEQIEQINYEIGNLNNDLEQLEKNLVIISKFSKISQKILEEEKKHENLKQRMESMEKESLSKDDVMKSLTKLFNDILIKFSFPKLSEAFIKESTYIPFVRGVKYNKLGSGGAVTMTTMAYFLSISLLKTPNKNHPGFLILDSPRKNLGADANDEFKDEEIFNSIIKYFISITHPQVSEDEADNEDKPEIDENIQIILINNGFPDFLPPEDLVKVFDGKGTGNLPYGLIDDIENL